ncbi:MAG: alpha/beta hydrolase, partial [Flavobacteriales bacterium]|nr:alpha/beta hydrolase [Flavobacteriales bacterium]
MKRKLSLLLLMIPFLPGKTSLAQDCSDCRYMSAQFDSVMVETVLIGEGENSDGNMQQLYADIYQPYGDTETDRPVVIIAFGGGFLAGARDDWYVVEICKQFAKAGYVAVANDYRIGVNPLEILLSQSMRIFFRPMQDMRAMVQYLKADYSELGNNYSIDTNRIIMGGASAGGITALMTAYCDKESEMAEMGNINALDDLGGFYTSTGFYPQYNWDVAATFNISGAIINADWIEPGDVPVISAHGNEDEIVPYGEGGFGNALLEGVIDVQGSSIVHQEALAEGVCSYLYTMEGEGHPSEETSIELIRSVVYRMQQRVFSVINGKDFCCPLEVDITPDDTLYVALAGTDVALAADVTGDNGNAVYQWCGLPCTFNANTATVQIQADTSWRYVSLIVTEGQCQNADLQVVMSESPNTSVFELENNPGISIFPQPASDQVRINIAK